MSAHLDEYAAAYALVSGAESRMDDALRAKGYRAPKCYVFGAGASVYLDTHDSTPALQRATVADALVFIEGLPVRGKWTSDLIEATLYAGVTP